MATDQPDTPMWVGFNARLFRFASSPLPKQKICYFPQIDESPTSSSVVRETMNMAKKVAEECMQQYVSVTYDLAIAKVAFPIQEEDSSYSNIFIQLGSFHILLSYFKAIGKLIDNSGGPFVLTETGIIAQGSLLGFLQGKHYNRCKRIHPIFSVALESLHFKSFLKTIDKELSEETSQFVQLLVSNPQYETISWNESITSLFEKYESYSSDTLHGRHGKTAQFWMCYIRLISLYHTFERAIRTGDYKLFISCLPEMMKIFFALNHQNYARWLVYFHDRLIRMEETHPGIEQDFEAGILSIRRTSKPFSRQPIDITLEQTINADAAGSCTGNSEFTVSIKIQSQLFVYIFHQLVLPHLPIPYLEDSVGQWAYIFELQLFRIFWRQRE